MRSKIIIQFERADKSRLDFMRGADLAIEGERLAFQTESYIATLKKGVKPNKKWRDNFIQKITQKALTLGYELRNFEFSKL